MSVLGKPPKCLQSSLIPELYEINVFLLGLRGPQHPVGCAPGAPPSGCTRPLCQSHGRIPLHIHRGQHHQQQGVWDRQEDEKQWLSSLFGNQSLLGNIKNYLSECERSNLFLITFQVLQSFPARGHTVWAFMDNPFPRPWVQAVSIRRTKYVLQTIAKPCIRYWLGNVWSWQTLLIYRMLSRLIAVLSFFFFLPAPYRRKPCSCSESRCQRQIIACFDVSPANSVLHTGTSQ